VELSRSQRNATTGIRRVKEARTVEVFAGLSQRVCAKNLRKVESNRVKLRRDRPLIC
jgi:hypothetical protein